ncbi:single-stranded-DNA-specific exonuclease RecJ [Alkalihalobacterium bogoriense]|uniref:single-stranded-DNA-specific exonuclease RecJ n=1 Tax=Alkalihalobacterium bogoriense TaxID=246272 RepID=UPI00047A4C32|nr:single-stranded-DNA-specific exonuclease RecJ [Alkalihalobacterium bogoriense]
MLKPKARWKLDSIDDRKVDELTKDLHVPPLVASLLVKRGLDTVEAAEQFLHIDKKEYYDPFLLSGMEETVERIHRAIKNDEKILVFGDYDADGVSSTTVMVYALQQLKANFDYYIPNRFTEGYGPNEKAFRTAKEQGYQLIVTVDTGISAVHEAEVAKELEIDFIVTDHHEAPPILPDAYAIVNPKKPGCTYPFKGLAGVGVAFKVAHALLKRVPVELLDIVVIGTIADLVPLVDENRLLAKQGIQALQHSNRPGIRALKKVCNIEDQVLNAEHVGFAIGPRINAAGRLAHAAPAVELLTTSDGEEAFAIAEEIDQLNKERQAIVNEMTKEAIEIVENEFPISDNHVLLIGKEGWNPGVIGIVASRLVEKYYRPTIILSYDNETGKAKGSARSIEGFDMFENLSESRDILPHFGGHPMAAGLTMQIKDVDTLRQRLHAQAEAILTSEDFIPSSHIDVVTSLDQISLDVIKQMEQLAPYGVANPTPKIMIKDVVVGQSRRIGSDENHLKLVFEQNNAKLDGIGFQLGHLYDEMTANVTLSAVGTLSVNEWNGHSKPQFMLEDIAIKEWQLFDWRNVKNVREKLEQIPEENRVLVTFSEHARTKLKLEQVQGTWISPTTAVPVECEHPYVFFLDLPLVEEEMKSIFQYVKNPERIYTLFFHEESHYFTSSPSREQFKWYYSFLKKKGEFDIRKFGVQLAKHKGWSKNTVEWMTKVFFELEFVTINNGIISLHPNPSKKDLLDSKTYRSKIEQASIENQFVYSSYYELKLWFDDMLSKQSTRKETVN